MPEIYKFCYLLNRLVIDCNIKRGLLLVGGHALGFCEIDFQTDFECIFCQLINKGLKVGWTCVSEGYVISIRKIGYDMSADRETAITNIFSFENDCS